MYVAGIAGAAVFYFTILGVNIWAATKKRKKIQSKSLDDLILGNRDLGLLLGVSSLVGKYLYLYIFDIMTITIIICVCIF